MARMLESMKYLGFKEGLVAFVTPSMSHAELRAALNLAVMDAGFISFRQGQHIKVWGQSYSLRTEHDNTRNAQIGLWHAVYWDAPYPHLIMTPSKELHALIAHRMVERFKGMDPPRAFAISHVTPKVLDCVDEYGSTPNYGPWNKQWDRSLGKAMFQTDWDTKITIVGEDKPAPPSV